MNFVFDSAIEEVVEFNYANYTEGKVLHIAYGFDKNFTLGAGVSMTSVILNNKDITVHFHIFTDHLDDVFSYKCNELAKKHNASITIYLLNDDFFSALPSTKAWSVAIYYRFIAFEYLSTITDKALYLDADVICKGDLTELLYFDFQDKYAAVIKDVPETRESSGERLNNKQLNSSYFNSGVMLVKLDEWKNNEFFQKALKTLLDPANDLKFFDQDVLNILYIGKVRFLSNDFNCIYGIKQELKNHDISRYKETIKDSTKLIHYIGVTKPWNTWANYPCAQYFAKAWKSSPWADEPLLGARTPKQFKKKSRHERLQGKYIDSTISYIQYLIAKLQKK